MHKPGGRVVAPEVIREVKPQYTRRAMDEKVEGEVSIECVVKADGTVGDMKIVKSLDPDLDKAALEAVGPVAGSSLAPATARPSMCSSPSQ